MVEAKIKIEVDSPKRNIRIEISKINKLLIRNYKLNKKKINNMYKLINEQYVKLSAVKEKMIWKENNKSS